MKNTNNNGKKRINKAAVAVASLVLATSTAISAKAFSASAVSKNAIYDIHACQAVKIPVKTNKNAIVKNKKLKTAATSDNVVKKNKVTAATTMAAVNAVKTVQAVKSAVKPAETKVEAKGKTKPAETTVSAKAKTKPAETKVEAKGKTKPVDTTVSVKNETKAVTIETVMDENKDTFTNIPTTDGIFSCGNPNLMMGEENMDAEEEISENDVTYSESSDSGYEIDYEEMLKQPGSEKFAVYRDENGKIIFVCGTPALMEEEDMTDETVEDVSEVND